MSSLQPYSSISVSQTPPTKKRTLSQLQTRNAQSAKRRRVSSMASVELIKELNSNPEKLESSGQHSTTMADRFVPSRPMQILPLQTSPRTNRIAKAFNLADDRLLNYSDKTSGSLPQASSKMYGMLRRSASELFHIPQSTNVLSAAHHFNRRQQCVLALDAPGVSPDPFTTPIAWSAKNEIAVACGETVYYQNLDTRDINRLSRTSAAIHGGIEAIEWGPDSSLVLGTSYGTIQLWDSIKQTKSWELVNPGDRSALSISWLHNRIATGRGNGKVSVLDPRGSGKHEISRLKGHRGKVCGVKWSSDGNYLASGDEYGRMYIWDSRAGKPLGDKQSRSSRIQHGGPVKALAWCPWSPNLLATGTSFPEGTIRIFNASSSLTSSSPTPLHTLPLSTSTLSLMWSPHCKELLSTHGTSFLPPLTLSRYTNYEDYDHRTHPMIPVPDATLTNSVVVHAYPTLERIATVKKAHGAAVSCSCLSPNGSMVFTVCPSEEAMKMWRVWGEPKTSLGGATRETIFDKHGIR